MSIIIDTIGITWYIIIFGFIIPMMWSIGCVVYSIIKHKTITIKSMVIGLLGAVLLSVLVCKLGSICPNDTYIYENYYGEIYYI